MYTKKIAFLVLISLFLLSCQKKKDFSQKQFPIYRNQLEITIEDIKIFKYGYSLNMVFKNISKETIYIFPLFSHEGINNLKFNVRNADDSIDIFTPGQQVFLKYIKKVIEIKSKAFHKEVCFLTDVENLTNFFKIDMLRGSFYTKDYGYIFLGPRINDNLQIKAVYKNERHNSLKYESQNYGEVKPWVGKIETDWTR